MRLKTSYSGLCLPDSWYQPDKALLADDVPRVCPDFLHIVARRNSGAVEIRTRVNFASRGWADGGGTCGSDSYVSAGVFPQVSAEGGNGTKVNVWPAHLASVWTSSVTIVVRVIDDSGAAAATIYVQSFNSVANQVTKLVTSENGMSGLNCGGVNVATITVNDNGTFSIA